MRWVLAVLALQAAGAGCDLGTIPDDDEQPGSGIIEGVALDTIVDGLGTLTQLTSPMGDDRVFVTERTGLVHVIDDGELLPTPFLDLLGEVGAAEPEQGLLGLAFHPDYASNGRFFVSYTDTEGDSRIGEYRADPPFGDVADPGSASLVLHVPQPEPNHNGGHVAFGPDGMLYIGFGDGGGFDDPGGNGQDPRTLLGSLLRINVDIEAPYVIPAGNPFAGSDEFRHEIWAIGLRNPWRFSWDPGQNLLFVADVGENAQEEVNIVDASDPGLNYGWPVAEGNICYTDESLCQNDTHLPQLVYDHSLGCAVVGGVSYRGFALPQLRGHYLFGDNCEGWVRGADITSPPVLGLALVDLPPISSITSIGEDAGGEVYVLTASGEVIKLVPEAGP